MKKYSKFITPTVTIYNSVNFRSFLNETKQWKTIFSIKYYHSGDFLDDAIKTSVDVRFFVLLLNDKIIGLAHIRKSPYQTNTYWLSYLSILEKYQNKGYSSILAESVFKWFSEEKMTFLNSSYSKDGFLKLKKIFNKLAIEYNVNFIDNENIL